jgi:uncharacterized SAM-binding protein YcdF (DUF218 family)
MFFILSKILFYVVMPLTWILVFLFIAVFSKREKLKRRALIIATTLLIFFTNPFLCNEAWLLWEEPPTPMSKLSKYDAAIILTGFTNQQKSPHDRIYTGKGADRVLLPIRLYKEGYVQKIIISGGSGSLVQKYSTEAVEVKKLLMLSGVATTDILYEDKSRNTHENAQFTKKLLSTQPNLKKLLLVTSAFHMRRAAGCFKKEGIATDSFSTDFYTTDRTFSFDALLIPQEAYLQQWQKLFHEVLGYITYSLMGYC